MDIYLRLFGENIKLTFFLKNAISLHDILNRRPVDSVYFPEASKRITVF